MIVGYGVPAYDDANFVFIPHWVRDGSWWYYRVTDGENAYGWQKINGKWYYLEESGDYESACWHDSAERDGLLEY